MTTIREAFDLPRPEDLRAMGFVIRLNEADPSSAEVQRLVNDYVVTPTVARELPYILDLMKAACERREAFGRFIHGSFGSGKSHFMTLLGLLLEHAAPVWDKLRPVLSRYHAERAAREDSAHSADEHEAWITDQNLLVCRIHLLSARGRTTTLDRIIYDGFNQALRRRGKAPFVFLDIDPLIEEARRDAQEFGDVVWTRLRSAGVVNDAAELDTLARDTHQGRRERFARAYLTYKKRDAERAGVDPRWTVGMHRLAAHAKEQGFGGVVLLLDEFLLWLAEKSGQEFVTEINNLNLIVDHSTGERAVPLFAFVARQRNLKEFFPDLMDEAKIHDHLDHHAERFRATTLDDVELRHIVKGRVLRPRPQAQAALAQAVAGLAEQHERILPALISDGDLGYLRDVYPFHPALIAMLIDVTALMQRERSALRILYELLVLHYPDLPLGQFLPVGSAFLALFPKAGVEASKKVELMQDIHHAYYARLQPALLAMKQAGGDFGEERYRALDQIVKTVLLAEVSPRLSRGGLTVERLVQLNSVDVEGETFRGRVRVAETDLMRLTQSVPDLQVAGQGKSAIVRFILGRVSLQEVLARARSKVDNGPQRFQVFHHSLLGALGLSGSKGFEEGGPREGDLDLQWRKTWRTGRVKLINVREAPFGDFEHGDAAFRILIDYPWDAPGHTVDEDRLKALNARKARGSQFTVCWLPRHMTPEELGVITELAAVRYLRSPAGAEDLLSMHSAPERDKMLEAATLREQGLSAQLGELLQEVYGAHGEFLPLQADVDGARPHKELRENLEHIAKLLLDRRYPHHPHFLAEPKKADLEALLGWMVTAADATVSVPFDDAVGKVLRNLGQPLELCTVGQTKASLRTDSRYIKDLLVKADADSVSWSSLAEPLRETFGLPTLVVDLFLCFLCRRGHRALNSTSGEPVEVSLGMSQTTQGLLRLQRGQLLGAAEWHRLRDLGNQLFGMAKPAPHRSLQAQDRFAAELRKLGKERRLVLQGLHQSLVSHGAKGGARLTEVATATARLAALEPTQSDSYQVLSELLRAWPEGEKEAEALTAVVAQAATLRDAAAELAESQRQILESGAQHPQLGAEVQAHLATLARRLTVAEAEEPLTKEWVQGWNRAAQGLTKRLVAVPVSPVVPTGGQPVGGPPPVVAPPVAPQVVTRPGVQQPSGADEGELLLSKQVDGADAEDITAVMVEVRRVLERLGGAATLTLRAVRGRPGR